MKNMNRKISKKLSYLLRHNPDAFGLKLDGQGWCKVDDLLKAFKANGTPLSRELLEEVVATNDKKRFAFNEAGTKIRASQGHSISIDLGYSPVEPPEILYPRYCQTQPGCHFQGGPSKTQSPPRAPVSGSGYRRQCRSTPWQGRSLEGNGQSHV
jgi:RNA:NAD 2'-phosphotransferase (TPT1/KptA family)